MQTASCPAHRGERAVQHLVEHAPSSGGLALWVAHADLPPGVDAPPTTTDGTTVFYAESFAALSLPRQAGHVAHAVLHIALRHPQRLALLQRQLGDVDRKLYNLCADAIVDSALAHLSWLQLAPSTVRLEDLLARAFGIVQDGAAALLEWDVESLYRELDDRRPDDGRGKREDGPRAARARALAGRSEVDLLAAATRQTGGQDAPEAQAEASRAWCERLQRAHAGDGVFSMLRTLPHDLPRTRTPWQQVLRVLVARGLAPRPELSWSRPARSWLANQGRAGSRRLPFEPGNSCSRRVPRLAVVVDVSGSIAAPLLEGFAREIEALARRHGASWVLVVGDDEVRHVSHHDAGAGARRGRSQGQGLTDIVFDGGGGTNFEPLLAEAGRHRPDLAVVLTDLQGPAGPRPPWPVVWAVPRSQAAASAPFGRVLVLD